MDPRQPPARRVCRLSNPKLEDWVMALADYGLDQTVEETVKFKHVRDLAVVGGIRNQDRDALRFLWFIDPMFLWFIDPSHVGEFDTRIYGGFGHSHGDEGSPAREYPQDAVYHLASYVEATCSPPSSGSFVVRRMSLH
eukprot:GHVS01061194.1.p1 GENE.GHVS01061194.1~~GHVS01061194.1.p1  ORF type:complete len:138 (-),score=7.16 GHVS01061194.1:866-1279(-)